MGGGRLDAARPESQPFGPGVSPFRVFEMRFLMCSYDFYPRIGGTESAGRVVATGLAERGYDVTVATMSPSTSADNAVFPFAIARQPDAATLLRLYHDADIVWHNQISLRLLWPWFVFQRRLVFVHHSPLATDTGAGPRFGFVKRLACRLGTSIFVSRAYRDAARLSGPVIPNSYDETIFKPYPGVARDRDVVFLGRLVREKGADILIDALALMAERGKCLTATIIGAGPEDAALQQRAVAAGLGDHVVFTGPLRGEELARTLARHTIMAMPSRWFEGLPVAAIEALACGCVVVGADSGGLPDAIGPCGPVLSKNEPATFAAAIERLTSDAQALAEYRAQIPSHLVKFRKSTLLDACEAVIRGSSA
jgi:glycogen synthase